MYIRKLYDPEDKLRLQIPGHGTGSAAGTAAQQEVLGKVTQSRSPQAQAAASAAAQGGRRYTTKMGLPSLYVPEENTWLSRGSFGDGYQFGDVTRGITGTMLETSENVFTGALRVAENAVDAVAGRAANFKPLERPLTEFVTRDLIDEEKIARGYTKYWSLPGWAGMALGVDPDRDSFLGDKGEALAQSAGQLTLAAGANSVGVPGELITGISSYGSEMESALKAGATPRQANASATISALGELITEKGSGAIKFGGKALDDVLVDNLTDGISNKLLKTLAKAGLGGIGEGNEEIASEMISRFGRWVSGIDDETFGEMLFSGDAREAYLDSFLSGFLLGAPAGAAKALLPESDGSSPKKTQGNPSQDQTTGPKTDIQMVQPQLTTPGETGKPTTASRPGDRPQRVLLTDRNTPMDSGTNPGITPDTARGNPDMVPAKPETAPQIQPESVLEAMLETDLDIPHLTTDLRTEADVNTDADSAVTPVSYEDALRDYLGNGTEPTAVLNSAEGVDAEISLETASKPREQVISELAPKIQTANMTPGRATIAAQEMYSKAEERFGDDMDAVLESYQPGQDPRKFLDGFQNAYILGKQSASMNTLNNSKAAAYLTQEQREFAYGLGQRLNGRMGQSQGRRERGRGDAVWPAKRATISRNEYKEIMRFARDKGIELAGFKHYDGKIETIHGLIEEVSRIAECFPGLSDDRRRLTIELSRTLDQDTFAQTHGRIVGINIDAYRDTEFLEAEYQKLVEQGWFVKGTNSHAIIAHEMGHVVEMVFGIDPLALAQKVSGVNRNEVLDFCEKNLSGYSAAYSDGTEIISECFASVFGSSERNEFALKIVELCVKIALGKE